jgi:hypothetical protein
MKAYSFHHKETGIFNGVVRMCDEATLALDAPEADHVVIEGHHDHLTKRVDVATGEVIDYTPPQPSKAQAAAADKINRNNAARARILQLEASQHRHVREHCLGISSAADELRKIDEEIFSLRSQVQ